MLDYPTYLPGKVVNARDIEGDYAEIARQLKELALKYNIKVRLFEDDIRKGVEPEKATLTDVRRSSSFAQYASLLILFYGEGNGKYKILKAR